VWETRSVFQGVWKTHDAAPAFREEPRRVPHPVTVHHPSACRLLRISTQALTAWLMPQGIHQAHAVMEATGTYGEDLALYLYQAGHRVSVVNPARIKAFGQSELQRNKSR
jgi:hypothetical protein